MNLHSFPASICPRSHCYRMVRYLSILTLLALWLPSLTAPVTAIGLAEANTASALQPLIGIGGGIKAVSTIGTTAYLGEGLSFVILDVSDPAHPQRLASLMMPAPIYGVQVINEVAYITYRFSETAWITSGLALVDVHDPAHPIILPNFYDTVSQSTNNLTYVTSPSGLVILDMSTIARPALVGSFGLTGTTSSQIAGNRAYLVGSNKLVILDISDPTHPVQIGEYGGTMVPLLYVNAVQVVDMIAYLATSSGLKILDVTNAANLILKGEVISQPATALSISGSRIYINAMASSVPDLPGGLLIIDATDLTNPTLIGSYTTPNKRINQFAIEGELAILAAQTDGVLIVDLHTPTQPVLISNYTVIDDTRMFSLAWPLIYIAANSSGLQIVNLEDTAHPKALGSYATFGDARLLDLADHVAFVANTDGLSMIDVRSPETPAVRARFPLTGDPQTLHVLAADGLAYIFYTYAINGGGLGGELRIIDMYDRTAPWTMSQYSSPTLTTIAAISNNLAYITTTDNTLQIVDLHMPAQPILRSTLPLPGKPIAVHAAGNLVYVATAPGGLLIIDATNPDVPFIRATYPTENNPGSLLVDGTLAYLSSKGQIHIVDLSNSSMPSRIGICTLPEFEQWGVQMIQIVGNRLYVSSPPFYIYLMGYFVRTSAVDITDPTAPMPMSDLMLTTKNAPQLVGDVAYYESPGPLSQNKVIALDISNPSHQVVRGSYTLPFEPDLLVNGPIVFAADGPAGLLVFRVEFEAYLPMIQR